MAIFRASTPSKHISTSYFSLIPVGDEKYESPSPLSWVDQGWGKGDFSFTPTFDYALRGSNAKCAERSNSSTSDTSSDCTSTESSKVSSEAPAQSLDRGNSECNWRLDEKGLLVGDNREYLIADSILQLQTSHLGTERSVHTNSAEKFTQTRTVFKSGEYSQKEVTRDSKYGDLAYTSNYHSPDISTKAHFEHSSNSNGTPSRLPFSPPPVNYESHLRPSNMNGQSNLNTIIPSSPAQNYSYQSQPHYGQEHLYLQARESFIHQSLSTPFSSSINRDSLLRHFDHSLQTAHPLATLYGLSVDTANSLIQNPRESGVSEIVMRLVLDRMRMEVISVAITRAGLEREQVASAGGPSGYNRKEGLYKTELCKSWLETETCRYGYRCQFAHGRAELKEIYRHPKFKSEVCRTFSQYGDCPYGRRCCFLHISAVPNSSRQELRPTTQLLPSSIPHNSNDYFTRCTSTPSLKQPIAPFPLTLRFSPQQNQISTYAQAKSSVPYLEKAPKLSVPTQEGLMTPPPSPVSPDAGNGVLFNCLQRANFEYPMTPPPSTIRTISPVLDQAGRISRYQNRC